jgi:hypothetical protein
MEALRLCKVRVKCGVSTLGMGGNGMSVCGNFDTYYASQTFKVTWSYFDPGPNGGFPTEFYFSSETSCFCPKPYVTTSSGRQNLFGGGSRGYWTGTMYAYDLIRPFFSNPYCQLKTVSPSQWDYGCETSAGGGGSGCREFRDGNTDNCDGSPILISLEPTSRAGLLTNPAKGVNFDIRAETLPSAQPPRFSWTKPGLVVGWLAIDTDADGRIASGLELFGNFSPQDEPLVPGESANGYRALRIHDRNRDGEINSADGVYKLLRLWVDIDHNGTSEASELLLLNDPRVGISSISLDYKESEMRDKHGNGFRYRSRVTMADGSQRKSYDVFLKQQPE